MPAIRSSSWSAWLGVELTDRHSALGDAMTTARIFRALVPKLRDGGIRTFAEAAQACLALTKVLDAQHRAGWVEPVTAPGRVETERTFSRIDSYPYRHRIREIMGAPPRVIAADKSLGEALSRLIGERVSSFIASGRQTATQRLCRPTMPASSPSATCCGRWRSKAMTRSSCRSSNS